MLCVVSLVTGICMNIVDKRRDTMLGIKAKLTLDPGDRVKISEVWHFSLAFWLISINCLIVYIDVLPFNDIAGQFYQDRYDFSTAGSDAIISITYIMGAVLCPIFGVLVDKVGKRSYLSESYIVLFSATLIMLVHLAFVLIPDCYRCWYSILPMVFLGIGYSIYAAVMWASIPIVVKTAAVGTAFGVATSIQNFGLAVAPLIMGVIQDDTTKDKGYYYVSPMQVSVFLFVAGVLGVLNAVWLRFEDIRIGNILNQKTPKTYVTCRDDASETQNDEESLKDILIDPQVLSKDG
jgi:MFS family permease